MPSAGRLSMNLTSDETSLCIKCEHNDKGFCLKKKRFCHIVKCKGAQDTNTTTSKKIITKNIAVDGLTLIRQYESTGVYSFRYNGKIYGGFKTIKEACSRLATLEIKERGYRIRNKHIEVDL